VNLIFLTICILLASVLFLPIDPNLIFFFLFFSEQKYLQEKINISVHFIRKDEKRLVLTGLGKM